MQENSCVFASVSNNGKAQLVSVEKYLRFVWRSLAEVRDGIFFSFFLFLRASNTIHAMVLLRMLSLSSILSLSSLSFQFD